jgi:archaellum biogenesis ATPase FlaH
MHFIPMDPKLVRKHERIAQEKEQKAREELERGFQEYVRKERIATLTRIAEGMRKDGKSEQSIQTVLKGIYEYWKWTSSVKDLKLDSSKPANSEPTPALSNEAPGVLLSEVETQQVHWLWPKRIPLGKITILEGDPGMGKSLLAVSIAACVSKGLPMPDETPGKQGGVILIAPEDSADDTIKPRLEAAGGDPSQVLLLNTLEDFDAKKIKIYDRSFSLSHDLDALEERIKQMKAVLVILDPLTAVLGKNIDQSRDQDVREVFTPLAHLAERTGCAILIIRHLSKVGSANLLYRGAGSIGIIAVARLALIVAPHPTDANKRILATTKNNLSKQATNIAYRIEENEVGVPYIQWLGEDHHDVKALVVNANLSTQRQAILRVLNNSQGPLALKDIADRTGQDYDRVRKTVHRMLGAKEVASPARGEYTTIDHPCITKPINDNHNVPAETTETTETLETLETLETDTAGESPKNDE